MCGVNVRRLDLDDLPACTDLAISRDWGAEEHKWRLLFAAGEVYGLDAPDGEGLASTTVLVRYGLDSAVVSMVLTARRYERQGLAGRVLRHVLDQAGDRIVSLHATAQGRPVYERLGFETVGRVDSYRGLFRGEPSGATRAATDADLDRIVELDAEIFETDRAPLLRRMPAFHERLRVLERDGRVAGYGGAWRNGDYLVIGPVVAQDADQAKALISDLATGWGVPVRLDLDTRQDELTAWARANGVDQGFPNALMVRGGRLPGDRSRLFTPFMVALG